MLQQRHRQCFPKVQPTESTKTSVASGQNSGSIQLPALTAEPDVVSRIARAREPQSSFLSPDHSHIQAFLPFKEYKFLTQQLTSEPQSFMSFLQKEEEILHGSTNPNLCIHRRTTFEQLSTIVTTVHEMVNIHFNDLHLSSTFIYFKNFSFDCLLMG